MYVSNFFRQPIIFPASHFGAGNGTIWLSDLECIGHEKDISLCGNSGWARGSCGHDEDLGLNCGKIDSHHAYKFKNKCCRKVLK